MIPDLKGLEAWIAAPGCTQGPGFLRPSLSWGYIGRGAPCMGATVLVRKGRSTAR